MKNKFYLLGFLLTVLVSGCASSSGGYSSTEQSAAAPQEEMARAEDSYGFVGGAQREQPKKIIVSAELFAETKNFDQDIKAINSINAKGYFESSVVYLYTNNDEEYRVFHATLKVPSEEYDKVKSTLMEIGNLKSFMENTEDVSGRYYDSQTRLETKKVEETQILKLIDQASNIEEILMLEEQLADVRLAIETYTENIVSIDRLTAYSTINLEIQEVRDYSLRYVPEDFGSKLMTSLHNSYVGTVMFFQKGIVFIAGLIIPLLLLGGIAAVVVAIRKKINRIKTRLD